MWIVSEIIIVRVSSVPQWVRPIYGNKPTKYRTTPKTTHK